MSNHERFGRPGFALLMVFTLGASFLNAAPVDFRTYTAEAYPRANGFAAPVWMTTEDGSKAGEVGNSSPSVFYSPGNALGTTIQGRVYPTTSAAFGFPLHNNEDDIFGFVLGFNPGDTTNAEADFLVLDWKRVEQTFNFVDIAGSEGTFNDWTDGGPSFVGLSLSRVRGVPTADELWQRVDLPGNEDPEFPGVPGSVEWLGFGQVRGDGVGYNFGPTDFHDFEISYEADRLRVWVDGDLEFDVTAGDLGYDTLPSGRFGLYECTQAWGSTFENFTIEPIGPVTAPGDFDGDGDVDGADFVVWQTNFPKAEGGTLDTGDADGDGDVDGADFVVWQTNFPFTPSPGATVVPEPASVILPLGGIIALARRQRRKR